MHCSSPFIKAGCAFGCGQCVPCRINRRRIWTHRIILEAMEHESSVFITLTYSDKYLPDDDLVSPRELQLFIKKIRKKHKVRFYGVGEYGEESGRPHYHVVLFGYPQCERGKTFEKVGKECCKWCTEIKEKWGKGNIILGSLTPESAAYVAGYVTKRLGKGSDQSKKPFARMSNRPGIGAGVMDDVASELMTENYKGEDVPYSISHGARRLPLGRYLIKRLRKRMGRPEHAPKEVMDRLAMEVQPLLAKARSYAPRGHVEFSFKQEIIEAGEGKRTKQLFWQKIRDQKRRVI